ncbi:MAG: HypC/HybG/HupF family hydrogenase formation chaperone, partial [Methanoregula sp.]|nr:HypC/HybG/HupF family hydrogenase formation chaperone [Methanoregula sp.]
MIFLNIPGLVPLQVFPAHVFVSYHCFYLFRTPTLKVRKECESSMCVAVPAEVLEIKEGNVGVVDYG